LQPFDSESFFFLLSNHLNVQYINHEVFLLYRGELRGTKDCKKNLIICSLCLLILLGRQSNYGRWKGWKLQQT